MQPDACLHDAGFRSHVNFRGGHLAICRGPCGRWLFIDASGQVSEYPPKRDGNVSQHGADDGAEQRAESTTNAANVWPTEGAA